MTEAVLHDYWRSTASYRVRIALNLLGVPFRSHAVDLLAGAQHEAAHLARNPQGFVPVLEIDGLRLTQSLAIVEYLDETRAVEYLDETRAVEYLDETRAVEYLDETRAVEHLDETRAVETLGERRGVGLLPNDAAGRARVRALAAVVAMDTHPICTPSVLTRVMESAPDPEQARQDWMAHFIRRGLAAFESLLDHPATGPYCHGTAPGLADLCLVPQLYNAERWGVEVSDLQRVAAVAARCRDLPAFAAAAPRPPGG